MELVKSRVYQYAKATDPNLPLFADKVFGTDQFFQDSQQVTGQQIKDLAAICPNLNMNWILNGRGQMLLTPEDILIEALEDELGNQQREIEKLKILLKSQGIK
ncbi:MAG: hypothetical protein ABIQ31_11150 [Ferruginibacter sp.]